MTHPFQCLLFSSQASSASSQILLAASKTYIYSIDSIRGKILSSWHTSDSKTIGHSLEGTQQEESNVYNPSCPTNERPSKRLKRSPSAGTSESSSAEIVTDNGGSKQARRRRKQATQEANISHMIRTSDGQYVIVITDEDKCVRTLKVGEQGSLAQIAARCMPKRPCAIALDPNEKTILCGDKFGDVYAFPLFGGSYKESSAEHDVGDETEPLKDKMSSKSFISSANARTVHTKKNKQALKNQQNTIKNVPKKKALDFDHQLLLGHVSLLTDLLCIGIRFEDCNTLRERQYIITADRDEHIRVSRGMPQAHIIEGYCLGHTEFVSKLCVLPWNKKLLVSGGGDDYLFFWDWISGEMMHKFNLKEMVQKLRDEDSVQNPEEITNDQSTTNIELQDKIAVSGLWAICEPSIGRHSGKILATCEGVPAIFWLSVSQNGDITHFHTTRTGCNVISIAISGDERTIAYSLDFVHEPFTTTKRTNHLSTVSPPDIGTFQYSITQGNWQQTTQCIGKQLDVNETAESREGNDRKAGGKKSAHVIDGLLYGFESLRKRSKDPS